MKRYQLITRQEWQKILDEKQQRENERWQGFSITPSFYDKFEYYLRVKYFHPHEYYSVIHYCVNNARQCIDLFTTLDKLGLYRGNDPYNNDSVRVTAALTTAITSERAILLELPQVYSTGGLLPPTPPRPPSLIKPEANKIGHYNPRDFSRWLHADEENWIELDVKNLPNQPFTLFNSTNDLVVYTGRLDNKGHAYVKLPFGVKYVDILFDHQKEKRAWYYDVPLQILGGVRDAGQNTLDLLGEGMQSRVKLDRAEDFLNPLQVLFEYLIREDDNQTLADTILQQHKVVHANNNSFANPITLPEVDAPETMSGALTRGATQFLVGFVTGYKIIKPLTKIGSLVKGMVAGVIADSTVFDPNEERLSNFVEEFPQFKNSITEYLAASPDDSAAEGRLKNALEGLLLGAVLEPFIRSLRLLKYARVRRIITEVRTKTKYKLEAIYPDGIHFNVVQKVHLATVESFTQRLGIKGGHNANAFYEAVSQYNIKIISETPTGIKGITQVIYQIPARDRANNIIPGEFKKESFTKTIYDPEVYSDQIILEYGQRAVATGYEDAMMAGAREYDIIIESIPFHAYLNTKTGLVENFFPMVK